MIKNKTGTDKVLSIYWFVILIITAAAIVYMVAAFYGKPYDAREIEANLLTNKVSDCLIDKNYLKDEVQTPGFKQNFLEACGLTFNSEDDFGWNNDQYYVSVPVLGISAGNDNLAVSCSRKLGNSPFCIERGVYLLDKNNQEYTLKIFTAVRKTEKNVK